MFYLFNYLFVLLIINLTAVNLITIQYITCGDVFFLVHVIVISLHQIKYIAKYAFIIK